MVTVMSIAQDFLENMVLPTIGEDIKAVCNLDHKNHNWIRVDENHWMKNDENGSWHLNHVVNIYEPTESNDKVHITFVSKDNDIFGIGFNRLNHTILEVLFPEKNKAGYLEAKWVSYDGLEDKTAYFSDLEYYAFQYGHIKNIS